MSASLDDENPMLALLKQAEEQQNNNSNNQEKPADPLIVFDGKNEDEENNDVPIGLSFRQPSFSHLTGNPIPKGGTDNIDPAFSIKENETLQVESDQKDPVNLSLHHRQSSYANLRLCSTNNSSTEQVVEIEPKIEEKDEENPIIVLTKEDEDEEEKQIGLSIRQPSFSSLQGHIIPKGGIESTICQIEEIPEEQGSKDDEGSNLGLHVRQSSYAHLKLNLPSDDNSTHVETIKEDSNQNQDNNPILVLAGDDDDDGNQPIGLSVRQPSFSSLGQTIIPKGGLESPSNMPALKEESEEERHEDQSLHASRKQSSYVHLKLPIPSEEDIEEMKRANFPESIPTDNNPIIVLTGDDNKNEDDDDESNEPIGLSVRQPSFSSLGQAIIPKGGMEAATMPVIIEENTEENKISEQKEEENEEPSLSLQVRQSSYTHLQIAPNNSPHQTFDAIPEESKEAANPVIVLTNDDGNEDENENGTDKPIGLSVRQPSFSSLYGNIVPKGGFETVDVPIIEIQEEYSSNESEGEKAPPSTKDKILSSLLDINKGWWEEIGYTLQEDKTYQRNCSMFNLPRCQKDFMNMSNSNNSNVDGGSKRSASVFQFGQIKKSDDNSKHSLLRVNSFGHRSQIIKVDMPEDEDDYDDIEDDIIIEDDENEETTINKMVNGPTMVRVSSHGNESTMKTVEMPLEQNSKQPKKQSNEPLKQNRQPSMVRVNSFGNASQELVVEMPILEYDDYNVSSNEYIEEEDINAVPETILELMSKPINSVVYDALNGESINEYKRQSISNALTEMKVLKQKCIDNGYNDESEYIEQVMNRVKNESSENIPFFELDEEIHDAEFEFQESMAKWQKEYENLDNELKQKLDECEAKYKESLNKLDEEFRPTTTHDQQKVVLTRPKVSASANLSFTAPTSQKTYKRTSSMSTASKPQASPLVLSPSCLKMKKDIQKLIEAQKYKESGELSLKLYRKEMIENQKQAKKRSQAYLTAKSNLWQNHQEEKNKILSEFESKKVSLSKQREESLGQLRYQFVQLKKMKTTLEENEKNQKFIESNQTRLKMNRSKKISNGTA